MARNVADVMEMVMERLQQQQNESHLVMNRVAQQIAGQQAVPRDNLGRTQLEARKDSYDFLGKRPTFERGKDRWADFAATFNHLREFFGVNDAEAKWALHGAIRGSSSRLVVASMVPDRADMVALTFQQYMTRMGEKFTPAAESVQMEAEYRARKQGKDEDVQNYINAKYELFTQAFPNAQPRDVNEFYKEATEGFLNKYVRDQMFCYEPQNIEAFGNKAVTVVQIERRRMKIGDSDSRNMDGLIPVTKAVRDRGEPMEVDALHRHDREEEGEDDGDQCECMALQEYGLKGPCFYCYRSGHQIRNCPRKSAGLPRSSGNRSLESRGRGVKRGTPTPVRGRNPNYRGNFGPKVANPTRRYRVNQIEEQVEEEEAGPPEDPDDDAEGDDGEVAHFLGELAL